jgi:hypothetical protein
MASHRRFSAPVSPPHRPLSTASTRYKGRPPPTVEHPFFLLRFSPPPPLCRRSHHHRAAADSPLWPLSDHFNHAPSTVPPSTTSPHPEPSTTTLRRHPIALPLWSTTPHRQAHSSDELLLPATPKRVHHPTALLPGPSPLHLVAGHCQNPAGLPPAPP